MANRIRVLGRVVTVSALAFVVSCGGSSEVEPDPNDLGQDSGLKDSGTDAKADVSKDVQNDTVTAETGSKDSGKDSSVDSGKDGSVDGSVDASTDAKLDAEAGVDPASTIAIACKDALATFYDWPSGLPNYNPSHRGDIVRCTLEKHYTVAELTKALDELGYKGKKLTSGAQVVRIAYRTERTKDANGAVIEGISGAVVFLPDNPRSKKVGTQPLVVAAHGSIGIADTCAPSRQEVTKTGTHLDDAHSLTLPLAGLGWTVVAPDYAGFGFGSPTAWSLAADEAHSVLDSTIAMRNLLVKSSLSGKVVVVGHSQGGHAALATHAYAKSYGLEGELVGVAAFAPLWINNGAWGAALSSLVGLNTTDNAGTIAYSIDYFYGHGEVYDGAGHGLDMFKADKKDQIKQIFTTKCLQDAETALAGVGAKPGDIYDFGFVTSVTSCELTGVCLGATASTWHDRFKADRPAIDAHGSPIVIWAGGKDSAVIPGRIKCALDRMQVDLDAADKPTTQIKLCGDATAVHSGFVGDRPDLSDGITRRGMTWVDQWVAARTLGEAEPDDCVGESAISDGKTLKCETPPSNKDY